jgi:hypothetical protein
MLDTFLIARVVEGAELCGQTDAFVELTHGQQTGDEGERCVGHLDPNGQRLVAVEVEQGRGLWAHDGSPVFVTRGLACNRLTIACPGSVPSAEIWAPDCNR